MSCVLLPKGDMHRELLEEVMLSDEAARRLTSLEDMVSEPAVGVGENFASTITRVRLEAVLGSGRKVRRTLILKKKPHKASQNGFVESHAYFRTEILLYKELLPLIEEVLSEQGIPALWPSFLGERGDYLVFSDLKSKNYRLKDRRERLDLEHATLAARSVALFHAGSILLRLRGQLETAGLEPTFAARDTPPLRRFIEGGVRTAASAVTAWGPEWREIGERLHKKSSGLIDELCRLRDESKSPLNVLNHGDLWTNNMMFKYSKGTDSPIGVRFIDFQLSHYNSFGFDLIYLMTCSLSPALRRSSKPEILDAYYRGLSECLQSAGVSVPISREDIDRELERLALYELVILFTVLPIVTADVANAIDFDQLAEGDAESVAHNPEIYAGKFKDEVDQELLRWAEQGLF